MKKIIVVGATSGIGREVALLYIRAGWQVGVAGRRAERLEELQRMAPGQVVTQVIDICSQDAGKQLQRLVEALGGMDVYFHSSGIGFQNPSLDTDTELRTVETNVAGFTRMINAAFHYFENRKEGGHIAVISSIAGTKGLGVAPAYSSTKRFQNTYLQSLAQLAHMRRLSITFTDIRPGFVDTDLLKNARFPLLMQPDAVARSIVKAVSRRQRIVTIDCRYRVIVALWRLIPRRLWERLSVK